MQDNRLYTAIKRIAWGYVLIHVNFNLGTLNILPNWAGYLLFLSAFPAIGEEEESANLLKPLGILICIVEVISWFNDLCGGPFNLYLINLIMGVAALYFHFQLLTNLANVAHKYECSQETKILLLRTVKTVLQTLFIVISYTSLLNQDFVLWSLLLVFVIITIWLCAVLFSFKKELEQKLKVEDVTE